MNQSVHGWKVIMRHNPQHQKQARRGEGREEKEESERNLS
jgi:hypothetical protein